MPRVTSTEFQQNVGAYSDTALREPVIITSHNRDRLVLMGMEDYNRLRKLDDEITDELIDEGIAIHLKTLQKLAE